MSRIPVDVMRKSRISQPVFYLFWMLGFIWVGASNHHAFAQPAIPLLSGRIVDTADILSDATKKEVSSILELHEKATSNQVVVLTIASLEGAVLEEYSLQVARSWALGQEGRDNGVLLLIAYKDRKMRIEVGYGLEGDLPDIVAKRIIDNNIRPFFRDGNFDGGVLSGVRAIVGVIEKTYAPAETSDDLSDIPLIVRFIFSLMFLGMPLFALYSTVFQVGFGRWVLLVFFLPFFLIGGTFIKPPYSGIVITALVVVGYIWFHWHIRRSPKWKEVREAMEKAKKTGKPVSVMVGGRTINVGSSVGSGSSSGGSSYSGGGGSFGGGGASGGW